MMADWKKTSEFVWRIENFNPHLPKIGNEIYDSKCLVSPNFSVYIYGYTQWYLELCPRTDQNGSFLRCLPICADYTKDCWISCEISILSKDGCVYISKNTKRRCSGFIHSDFSDALVVQRSKIPHQIDLTLRCSLSVQESGAKNENNACDVEALSRDLRNLYMNGDHCDLVLWAGDDIIPVHRAVLCIRAPKLAEKIRIQDRRNSVSIIKINNFSTSVLKVLMEYIYSGKIDGNIVDILPELYKAAKEYNLDHLKNELLPAPTNYFASTKIRLSKELLTWEIRNFSSLKEPVIKLMDLNIRTFVLALKPYSTDSYLLCFKIAYSNRNEYASPYISCKICAVDNAGGLKLYAYQMYCFELDQMTGDIFVVSKEKWNFLALVKKSDLISNKDKYLPYGTLKLQMEFEITDGKVINDIFKTKISLKTQSATISHLNHLGNDLQGIYELRNHSGIAGVSYNRICYNDVILQIGSEEIGCHRSILAARSPVFGEMFQHSNKSSDIEKVNISGIEHETLLSLVQYIYSGQLNGVSVKRITRLYFAARKYRVHSLTTKCVLLLERSLSAQNVCYVLSSADKRHSKRLLSLVSEYIERNKAEVCDSNGWKKLMEKAPALTARILEKVPEKGHIPQEGYKEMSTSGSTMELVRTLKEMISLILLCIGFMAFIRLI